MAAFSQQLLVDSSSVFSPHSLLKNSGFLDEFLPTWNQLCPNSSGDYPHLEGSSMNASNQESSCLEQQSINNEAEKQGNQSSLSMADYAESGEQGSQICSPADKKRKSRNGSSSYSANSKVRGKKQRGDKGAKKDDKKDKKDQNKANIEEPPKGYIHVRARRGEATDSHSLAERVRREKISERMKMLQALVPGCDKVTGKALMLDEIINYVQSLQNQVEFLSMRLASLDPMSYNFGLMGLDPITTFGTQGIMDKDSSTILPMPPIQSAATPVVATNNTILSTNFVNANAITTSITAQPPIFIDANTITDSTNVAFPSAHVIDSSVNLLPHEQKPSVVPPQDDRSLYWGSGEDDRHGLNFFNQFGFGATN